MKARGIYVTPNDFVQFAEPAREKSLSEHIATRDRSPDFYGLGFLLPNPDPILKKQGKDVKVYRELLGDAHVGGCVRRRKAAVKALESRVNRKDASARITKVVIRALQRLDMDRLQDEIMNAPLFGWQPLEAMWKPAVPMLPVDLVGKPQEWFHFDTNAQLRFRSREQPLFGEELPPRKFLVATQGASYSNPYGFPDLSMCFWPSTFKRGGLKFWMQFTEKFGTDWVIGKQPRGTGQAETDKFLDQLEAMVQDAVAAIPDDSSVDIVSARDKGASADLYRELLMFCRSEVSIALLGQNQSTEANSNRASAQAGLEVAESLRDGDAKMVAATINRLIRWIVDLNEGEEAAAPEYELFEEEDVNTAQAERDETLTRAGVKFTPGYWKRTYQLEQGDIEEEPATQPASAAAFAEQPETDAVDDLVAGELQQWEALSGPMVAPLRAAIDEAVRNGETAQQLLARLPDLLDRMDAEALHEALTSAAFTARLAADAGIENA